MIALLALRERARREYIHARDCAWAKCPGDCCDCDCGTKCGECGSWFWFKTHPSATIREDGPIGFFYARDALCRWCWFRRERSA